MSGDREIGTATLERQLDRLLLFFPRIDAKVSALFAVSAGEIAVAAMNLKVDDWKRWWIAAPAVAFLLVIGWVMVSLYRCTYPHLDGGSRSMIYFNEISKRREAEYVPELLAVGEATFRNDVAGQIWRNAGILACKYGYLKQATIWAMLSLIPWTALLVATSLTHWTMPTIR